MGTMRTSSSARLTKIAALGTAGFLVLAMSGVAVTAAQADTTADPPTETVPPENPGGGDDHGDDHGDDGDDHGGGKGKGKGNPPDPEVVQTPIEGELDCELGVPVQVETVTTVYEWVKGKWVLSDVSTTELSDAQYRPLTDAEYAEFCVTEEQPPADDDGEDGDDDEVAGTEKAAKKSAAAKAAPQAAAEVEVLGVEAEAPTALPTAVSAGLGGTPAGSPLGSGMVAGGLGLLALAGIMLKRRPVLDESRR
jgi:hypothetical protein